MDKLTSGDYRAVCRKEQILISVPVIINKGLHSTPSEWKSIIPNKKWEFQIGDISESWKSLFFRLTWKIFNICELLRQDKGCTLEIRTILYKYKSILQLSTQSLNDSLQMVKKGLLYKKTSILCKQKKI